MRWVYSRIQHPDHCRRASCRAARRIERGAAVRDHQLVHAIVNPAAGNGASGRSWPAVEQQLQAAGLTTRTYRTTARGDATTFARQIASETTTDATLIAVGGDGTVNEVVNGLMQARDAAVADGTLALMPNVRLATIPSGTGKDFARAVQTRTATAAIEAIQHGDTVRIDIGRARSVDAVSGAADSRYFAVFADGGLGAQAADRINRSSKALGAYATYAIGAVHAVSAFKPWEVAVDVDGVPLFGGRVAMVVCANTRTFAGGMLIAPQASLNDGLLDILIVKDVTRRTLLTSLMPRVYRGKHIGHPSVIWVRGSSVRVHCTAGMGGGVDGEVMGGTPLEIDVVPRVLDVVCASGALATHG